PASNTAAADAAEAAALVAEVAALAAEVAAAVALAAADVAALDVESSEELPAADRKKIEEQFSKLLGKKVEAHYSIQSQLLGGLRVTAAGRTYDGTLSGWLEKMEEKIMGGHL
ncbi:hypothetical protein EBR78_07275, partial [bacterium]|nr:hypothetical protein [bacterium]